MPDVDNRVLEVVRGEALGGTSRVNGMVYTRGAPGDYNRWKEMGHSRWGYDDLEPYFVKSETALSQPPSSFRGREGWSPTLVRSSACSYFCLQVLGKTGHLRMYRSKFCISKTSFRPCALSQTDQLCTPASAVLAKTLVYPSSQRLILPTHLRLAMPLLTSQWTATCIEHLPIARFAPRN